MANPNHAARRRFVIFLVVLGIGFIGVSYLHYQDMVKPMPEFDALQRIAADGMRYAVSKPPRGVQYSFEFADLNGKRFQTKYMEAAETKAIQEALSRSSVTLFVGPWQSALESDSIFTIYANNKRA